MVYHEFSNTQAWRPAGRQVGRPALRRTVHEKGLAKFGFAMQSQGMESNWASENLQVIRTLMERSALYRRTLAPIMIGAGVIGLAGATLPCFVEISTPTGFSRYWMGLSLAGLATAFLLVRRQALKESEPFWSPPTRRVMSAMGPPFFAGLAGGSVWAMGGSVAPVSALVVIWMICYGCGLHAAGFFMARGIRWLGWMFVFGGGAYLCGTIWEPGWRSTESGHYAMGLGFGLLQLAYGIYLHFTEKKRATP